jgi:hypothetical protein
VSSTVGAALNLSARLRLATRSLTLESLKLFQALSAASADLSLRGAYLVIVFVVVGFSMIPAALWAGAITPVTTGVTHVHPINVPNFTDSDGTHTINNPFSSHVNYTIVSPQGTFTFSPAKQFSGFIIDNARNTMTPSGQVSSHPKLDRTGYTYATRSFGVGSGAGLLESFDIPPIYYEYRELGLRTSANCIYNDSADLSFDQLTPDGEGFDFLTYNAVGRQPNGVRILNAAASSGTMTLFSVSGGFGTDNTTYVTMAASSAATNESIYAALHHIQCHIVYEPWEMLVAVNASSKTINVTAPAEGSAATFPNLRQWTSFVSGMFNLICWVQVTTYLTSVLGDAFVSNIDAVAMHQNVSANATNLYGVTTALESMFDDILHAVSAAQLMVSDATQPTDARVQSNGFVFGSPAYIYAVTAIDVLVTLTFLVEAIRTRWWKDAPRFDFMDIKAVILGASAPDNGIAEKTSEVGKDEKALGLIALTVVDGSSLRAVSRDHNPPDYAQPLIIGTRLSPESGKGSKDRLQVPEYEMSLMSRDDMRDSGENVEHRGPSPKIKGSRS